MTVITISRQFGSGADEIAYDVCDRLGYHLFGKRELELVVQEAGLTSEELVDFSEDNYKAYNLFDRLFGGTWAVSYTGLWPDDIFTVPSYEEQLMREESGLKLVRLAVRKASEMGGLIILGRGGQVILKDQPNVLHVRVIAPLEDRIQRVKESIRSKGNSFNADISPRREAVDLIRERDEASADYIKRLYHQDWNDPLLYHLVINTGKVGLEAAAKTIADLVQVEEKS